MRCWIGLAFALLLGSGCASQQRGRASQSFPVTGRPDSRTGPKPGPIIVTPAGSDSGRITSVNASARFVVITYPVGTLPGPERRLNVYRSGLKVAELKVTGPSQDINTVADILAGECEAGDEVRED